MDYPKSVPNVGLVNGRFVDENPATGQIGSLIPSGWGNAVTEEVLNVLLAAGLAPDEMSNTQLIEAINVLHDFVRLPNKPTTVDGYGITDALKKGEHGLGATTVVASSIDTVGLPGGFYAYGTGSSQFGQYTALLNLPYLDGRYSAQIGMQYGATEPVMLIRSGVSPSVWGATRTVWHSGNLDPSKYPVKAATLAGYGIKDAYTTLEVDRILGVKADGWNADLTGMPTCPTAPIGTGTTQVASTAYVLAAINRLVDSAPGTLDTLRELAAALGGDENFAATVAAQIGAVSAAVATKANKATTLAGYGITDGLRSGDFGLGAGVVAAGNIDAAGQPGGFYAAGEGPSSLAKYASVLNLPYLTAGYTAQIAVLQGQVEPRILVRGTKTPSVWTPTREIWHDGNLPLSTHEQAVAGTDDKSVMTPVRVMQAIVAKFSTGFAVSLAQNGYLVFPSWLGGLTLQWGRVPIVSASGTAVNFPLQFPNYVFTALASAYGNGSPGHSEVAEIFDVTGTAFKLSNSGGAGSSWFAIGC